MNAMNGQAFDRSEWHFSKLLEDFLKMWDGLSCELAMKLVHSWEFTRELVMEYPLIVERRARFLEEIKGAVDDLPHWKCEDFPGTPWFALSGRLQEKLVDEFIDANLSASPGINTMAINLRWSDREIMERIALAKERFNSVYDETREMNEAVNKRFSRDIIRRFEEAKGGWRHNHGKELVALGKERLVAHVGGNREKAKRYYNDLTGADDCVRDKEKGDKSFYKSKNAVRDALDRIKDSFPLALQERLFQKVTQ